MNLSNYSFDENKLQHEKKIKVHIGVIISIVFLLVLFIILLVVYFGMKKSIKKDDAKANDEPVSNVQEETFSLPEYDADKQGEDFVGSFNYNYGNVYGFSFNMIITGSNNDAYYLGEFLQPLYENDDVYIEGLIYGGGAEFSIYRGQNATDDTLSRTMVVCNEEGVFACIEGWGYLMYDYVPTGTQWYTTNKYFIQIGDAISGREILTSFCESMTLSSENEDVDIGETTDGDYAITFPDGTLTSNSEFDMISNIFTGYHGECAMAIIPSGDAPDRTTTLKCEGDDISFILNTTENPLFIMPAVILDNRIITYEEYEQLKLEFEAVYVQ